MRIRRLAAAALLAAALAGPVPALADPPPWAPAHGARAKHKHGREVQPVYVLPYGLDRGTCSRDLIGGAIGGVAGGVLGSQVGKGDGRLAATAAGVVIGVLVGGAIGRSMDEADQACVGQVLEHMDDRRPVRWAHNGDYTVVPLRTFESEAGYCREYQTRAVIGGRTQTAYGRACRQPDGAWRIMN
jgi:surface antigen